MGKLKNRVKGVLIFTAAAGASILGIEVGGAAGAGLYEDLKYVTGHADHPVYQTGTICKKYTQVNPYNGNLTRVHYSKKANDWVANSHQPKGYVK